MDTQTAMALAGPLAVGIAALGSGIGLGLGLKGALSALGRQPEAFGKIITIMIIGAALIESLVIYALVIFFLLFAKLG